MTSLVLNNQVLVFIFEGGQTKCQEVHVMDSFLWAFKGTSSWELDEFWLVVLGLMALWDNISVYIELSPKEREKEEKG